VARFVILGACHRIVLQVGNGNHYPKTYLPYLPGRKPLTRREWEVLERIVAGASNKEAGRQPGISPRTIEDHRANIMKKVGVKNAAELIRLVLSDSQSAGPPDAARDVDREKFT
jgi:DNA-binding NarL/FixJ family response regulator